MCVKIYITYAHICVSVGGVEVVGEWQVLVFALGKQHLFPESNFSTYTQKQIRLVLRTAECFYICYLLGLPIQGAFLHQGCVSPTLRYVLLLSRCAGLCRLLRTLCGGAFLLIQQLHYEITL